MVDRTANMSYSMSLSEVSESRHCPKREEAFARFDASAARALGAEEMKRFMERSGDHPTSIPAGTAAAAYRMNAAADPLSTLLNDLADETNDQSVSIP